MMKKMIAGVLLAGVLLTAVSCADGAAEDTTGEYDVTFTEDLTLDALYALLLEKGDDLRFADIPEKYGYLIPMPMVPQLVYPINAHTTFYIMQISESEYSYILSVRTSTEEDSKDYTGVNEILAFLEGR